MVRSMNFEISDKEVKDLITRCCKLGESLDIRPDKFSVMLTIAAKYLTDTHQLEVDIEKIDHKGFNA